MSFVHRKHHTPYEKLGWAGLGWAGLGWAGLGWDFHWTTRLRCAALRCCFCIQVTKSKTNKTGYQVVLKFYLSQHTRYILLMNSLIHFFHCGKLTLIPSSLLRRGGRPPPKKGGLSPPFLALLYVPPLYIPLFF